MSRSTVLTALTVVFLSSIPMVSAPFWDKKPYPKWSKKECNRILEDSPWAYPYAISGISIPGATSDARHSSPDININAIPGGTGDREVHLFLLIRFVSAKPIKAAIGKLKLLAQPENRDLVQMVEEYVNQPESDDITAEVTWYSEPAGHPALLTIQGFLRTATLESLRNKVYLSSSSAGTYVPLSQYVAPNESQPGALLFFPRFDAAGNAHLQGDEREMLLHMETGFGLVDLILKPSSMKFDGSFTF